MKNKKTIQWLVGKTIQKIFMNENNLKFQTDEGDITFNVEGDCCSSSVFYDFYGVKEVLGKKIKDVNEVKLTVDDRMDGKNYQESISVYGYQLFWEDEYYGDRTSVFSFRNYSNGYYGGWMNVCSDMEVLPELNNDVVMTTNEL